MDSFEILQALFVYEALAESNDVFDIIMIVKERQYLKNAIQMKDNDSYEFTVFNPVTKKGLNLIGNSWY